MAFHGRLRVVRYLRARVDRIIMGIPLPDMNPDYLSGLSVVVSVVFLLVIDVSQILAFAMVLLAIVLDWIDGVVARKYGRASERGYIVDTVCDRMSEGLILCAFFWPWFYFYAANNLLCVYSMKKKLHLVFPLRHVFAVYFFVVYVI